MHDGQTTKFLFSDRQFKKMAQRGQREEYNFSPVVKNPQARNYSQKPYHPYSRRNNYDNVRHQQGGSNYETASGSDFHRGKPIHGKKKGARQPVQRK